MELSVIVPVYDERTTVLSSIERVLAIAEVSEVIVVDDGSTDGSSALLRGVQLGPRVQIAFHDRNRGKTAAVRTGLALATGDAVVVHDADLEYDPRDLPRLLGPLEDRGVGAVFGTRYPREERATLLAAWLRHRIGLPHGGPRASAFYDAIDPIGYYGVALVTELANALYGLSLSDEATCYKVVRTELMRAFDIGQEGFELCPALVSELALGGHRIVEVPIRYAPRSRRDGKKIRWRDGLDAARVLLERRLRPRPGPRPTDLTR